MGCPSARESLIIDCRVISTWNISPISTSTSIPVREGYQFPDDPFEVVDRAGVEPVGREQDIFCADHKVTAIRQAIRSKMYGDPVIDQYDIWFVGI